MLDVQVNSIQMFLLSQRATVDRMTGPTARLTPVLRARYTLHCQPTTAPPRPQGDCDSDSECGSGLVCGEDNCRDFTPGAMRTADCCMKSGSLVSTCCGNPCPGGGPGPCPYSDENSHCEAWKLLGYCSDPRYSVYMLQSCQQSCRLDILLKFL